MSASFTSGQSVYATHTIIGTEVGAGTPVTVVETYEGYGETRYLVRTPGGFKVHCYATDLTASWSWTKELEHV